MSTWSADSYLNYQQLTALLTDLAAEHPDIMQLDSIGLSHEHRNIWLVTLTRFSTGQAADKPATWIDGNIHSVELVSSIAAINFIHWIIQQQDKEDVQRCLDTRTLYICPRINPDGAECALQIQPSFPRSGTKPYPYNETLVDGIDVHDINGDGHILTMRIADTHGPWKISDADARLMVRREPTETGGNYFRLLPEGLIRNYDGFHLPAASKIENLDFNRNFPVQWQNEQQQPGAGDYPASEKEVKAVIDFISTHPNICAGLSLHSYSGVLLRPYSFKEDEHMPAEDLWLYQAIGKKGEQLTGYPAISAYHDFRYHPQKTITGAMDDWLYDSSGRIAWTVELWSAHRQAGIEMAHFIDWFREHPVEDDLKLLAWNDQQLQGQAFVNWHPYQHPQLGEIELGGWNTLYSIWNPPLTMLQNEIDRLPEWLLWHTLITPRLEWLHCEVRLLEKGIYQVEAAVVNSGWLPTQISEHALKNKLVRGVIFEIDTGAGIELLQGQYRVETSQLKGRHDTPSSPNQWLNQKGDATDDRVRVQWIIRSRPGISVHVSVKHERAGTLHQALTLP